jgi:hypothetical protein
MALGDVISPLKELFPVYRWIARQWDLAICDAFDVDIHDLYSPEVVTADHLMRSLERAHLFGDSKPLEDSCWDAGTTKWGLYRNYNQKVEMFGMQYVECAFGKQLVDDLLQAADLKVKP